MFYKTGWEEILNRTVTANPQNLEGELKGILGGLCGLLLSASLHLMTFTFINFRQ